MSKKVLVDKEGLIMYHDGIMKEYIKPLQDIVGTSNDGYNVRGEVNKVNNRVNEVSLQLEHIEKQVESVVNMEQFPRLDNEIDDTNRIKRAIEYSTKLILNNDLNSHKIIEFNSGMYVVSDTIQIPTFIKIKSIGHVCFLSKVNGVLFNLFKPANLSINNNINSKHYSSIWGMFRGSWLNGSDGSITIVLDKNINKDGTIALNIGNTTLTYEHENFTGWWLMNDVTIDGFDIGMKFNSYNNFLGKCENFLITQCNKGVSFVNSGSIVNSGEGFTFSKSIFGDNIISVDINNWVDLELSFTDCSFDFTGTVLKTGVVGVYRFTSCHFEGIGYTNKYEEIGGNETSIVYSNCGYWTAPNVFVSGCDFMSVRSELFKAKSQNGMNLFIEGLTSKGSDGYQKLYELCNNNVDIQVNNFIPDKYLCMIPQRKLNIKNNPCFDKIDETTNIYDETKIDGYNFKTGFTGRTSISNKNMIDGKSLKIVVPNGGLWCQISSEQFNCKTGDKILNNFWWFVEKDSNTKIARMSAKTTFYDKDNNVLPYPSTSMDDGAVTDSSDNNTWCRLRNMEQVIAPSKATSFVVTYTINPISSCNLYLTEFYTLVY